MLSRFYKDRRRAQAGTTLIELLVALAIAGLALALVVGTISTGILDATLAKRNTAVQAVMQYEMEQVSASAYNPSAPSYSDCFATEKPMSPTPASGYLGLCPPSYTLRADVTWQTYSGNVQSWTIAVGAWPSGSATIGSIQLLKSPHQ